MSAGQNGGVGAERVLVLASSSPRRASLLASVGVDAVIEPADVDETAGEAENARDLVQRLAVAKARAIADRRSTAAFIVGADTVVTIDGEILGKPVDDDAARRALTLLSGRVHEVMTGVAVVQVNPHTDDHTTHAAVAVTSVEFKQLDQAEIDSYIASGEPMGKAGSYAIQGRGGLLVRRIDGTHDNVVGLPLSLVDDVLELHGRRLRDFSQ